MLILAVCTLLKYHLVSTYSHLPNLMPKRFTCKVVWPRFCVAYQFLRVPLFYGLPQRAVLECGLQLGCCAERNEGAHRIVKTHTNAHTRTTVEQRRVQGGKVYSASLGFSLRLYSRAQMAVWSH